LDGSAGACPECGERRREAGLDDAAIVARLEMHAESVPTLLRVAEAKLVAVLEPGSRSPRAAASDWCISDAQTTSDTKGRPNKGGPMHDG
jgi:hypothetical protein